MQGTRALLSTQVAEDVAALPLEHEADQHVAGRKAEAEGDEQIDGVHRLPFVPRNDSRDWSERSGLGTRRARPAPAILYPSDVAGLVPRMCSAPFAAASPAVTIPTGSLFIS